MSKPSYPPPRHHIQLMFGNGGGGHKASALAVQTALQPTPLSTPLSTQLHVELTDASAIAGAAPGDWLYNLLLSYDAVSCIELMHSALHNVILPLALPSLRHAFRQHFAKAQPSCVVSFVPILNAVFADSLPASTPLLTVLTDFSHTHGHPWIQHPRQHIIAGTHVAVAQAVARGFQLPNLPSPSMRVSPTSGMVVHPRFYTEISPALRRRHRADLGFPPDLPTILILFGATPPTDRVVRLVDNLLARPCANAVNVIAICAKNRGLFERLVRRKHRRKERRLYVTGFTNDIPLYMQLSDVLVGKPGPGVVSEAFVSGLALVLLTGGNENHVMKQERDVLDWVRSERIGIVARSVAEAAKISFAQIEQMRRRVRDMPRNLAVFEVRRIILQALNFECAVLEHSDLHEDEDADDADDTDDVDDVDNVDDDDV